MLAISQVATNSTALSVPASVLAAPVSDLVSTRLTPVAVAAPLANTALTNEPQNAAPVVTASASANEAAAAPAGAAAGLSSTLGASGPSTPFLAQLIGQSDEDSQTDSQIALAATFGRFAPAPSYNTFLGYSIVRYRPSDAGLPSADTPSAVSTEASQAGTSQSAPAASDYSAYNATQSRNQSALGGSLPQFVVAG
jgi:hypothetical protein